MPIDNQEDVSDVLEHFGVKGMKWGVRRAEKKAAKADAKWEKSIYSHKGAVAVHNATAKRVNAQIDVINESPKFKNKEPLNQADGSKLKSDYIKAYESIVSKSYSEAVKEVHGSNPSGTKEAIYVNDKLGERIVVRKKSVAHADGDDADISLLLRRNDKGLFSEVNLAASSAVEHGEVVDDFLAHYGVKGMKWGVRRNRVQPTTKVRTTSTPGKKVAAEGGTGQKPSADAVRTAVYKQKAVKSTTDSLSNKELQALVNRLNLEQQYAKLNPPPPTLFGQVKKFVQQHGKVAVGGANAAFGDSKNTNTQKGLAVAEAFVNLTGGNGSKKKK